MRYIDLNDQKNVRLKLYPDNQPHVNILREVGIYQNISLTVSLTDSLKVLQMQLTANAIERSFNKKAELRIPYLMGARFDHKMEDGDSIDIEVIADIINNLHFDEVHLFDVHSDVSTSLIKNSINFKNDFLVSAYHAENAVLICPDQGATKKMLGYQVLNTSLKEVVYCTKTRDVSNGNLTIKVLEPERCEGRHCVIIDDICDGGGTFLGIATQIKPKSMTLIVSHGIFSQGFATLEKYFGRIITTNSLRKQYDSRIVQTLNIF